MAPLPPEVSAKSPTYSMLYLNTEGRFYEPRSTETKVHRSTPVSLNGLHRYLKRRIVLPEKVTDVFVWVHGWRNSAKSAHVVAHRLFASIDYWLRARQAAYPRLGGVRPAYVAVHWPSNSRLTAKGYRTIRNRAQQLTEEGEAEFFLASLLGYLDGKNQRVAGRGSKTLRAKGGFYVHCLGHSFGGRFLTSAIQACATPNVKTLTLLGVLDAEQRQVLSVAEPKRFDFTIDTVCILQMAAPAWGFGDQLQKLVVDAPITGPVALTHSASDRANCLWHAKIENGESGIGCTGAKEPADLIGGITMHPPSEPYQAEAFRARITNVDASAVYHSNNVVTGAHSNYWHDETMHLIAGLANLARSNYFAAR